MSDVWPPVVRKNADGRVIMKSGVRNARLPLPARLKFTFRLQTLLAPGSFDVDAKIPDITNDLYGNDSWNDCVMATRAHHARRLFYKSKGSLLSITFEEVKNEYIAENRAENDDVFDDDQGLDFQDSLKTWQRGWNAAGQNLKISSFQGIQLDKASLRNSVFAGSGVQVVVHLPDNYNVNYGNGVWDDTTPVPRNSGFIHCFLIVAYDSNTVTGVTWGIRQTMTWDFLTPKLQSAILVTM